MKLLGCSILILLAVLDVNAKGVKIKYSLPDKSCYIESKYNSNRQFFKGATYEETNNEYEKNFDLVWNSFSRNSSYQAKNRANFFHFAQSQYPAFAEIMKLRAPTLKFDFFGENKSYVLQTIKIRFLDLQVIGAKNIGDITWYDVILRPSINNEQIISSDKLRFIANGSSELRFWANAGTYLMDITFIFLVEGKELSEVSTGAFYMTFYD